MKLSPNTALLWLTISQAVLICYAELQKLGRHNEFIGFTAWSRDIQAYSEGERVYFTGADINEGDYYVPRTSVFTCPYQGVFYVSLNLLRYLDADVGVRLVQERQLSKQSLLSIYSGHEDNPYSTVSNSLIFECQPEDLIYLEGIDGTSDYLFGSDFLPYSTYTIMLLHATGQQHDAVNAFSAYKVGIQEYAGNDSLNFNGVVYSDGNYAQAESAYNCIIGGIYYVNYNLHTYGAIPMPAALYMNGSKMLDTEVFSTDNSGHTYTNAGLMECPEGGTIEIRGEGEGAVFGGPSRFSTFSAFYLAPSGVGSQHDAVVGFSVYKSQTQTYGSDETIRFDSVIWDEMGYFNLIRSEFVCPTNGIFYVFVNYYRDDTNELHINVVREETEIILATEDDMSSNPGIGVSNSGLTRCFSGDVIKVTSFDDGSVYGEANAYLTTFTIFMVYEY